jgi:tetratricopeptide (TPR) repeat protein
MKVLRYLPVLGILAATLLLLQPATAAYEFNKTAEDIYNRGVDSMLQGNYAEALAQFDEALAITPQMENALLAKSFVFIKLGENQTALGNNQNAAVQYQNAIDATNKAISFYPNFDKAWNNQAVAYRGLNNYQGALTASEKAIALSGNYSTALNIRGWALNGLGRYQEALISLDLAIAEHNDFTDAWVNKATALNGLKQYADALVAADKALELNPENANAWFIRATILENTGKTAEAQQAYAKAKELNPALVKQTPLPAFVVCMGTGLAVAIAGIRTCRNKK